VTGTVRPKQSLGQNFLIDENIVRNIVRRFDPMPDDVVVEIGPGRGILTRSLVARVRRLIMVEIDGRIIDELRNQFTSPGVTIVHGDFLDVELNRLRRSYRAKLRLIGNIPYHLTSPILFKVFEEHAAIRDVTLMIQREVARRIIARPGTKDYGILSVAARLHGVPSVLFDVSPNCFYPKPGVRSSVFQFRLYDELPPEIDRQTLGTVVRTVFGKRRKTLRNGLRYLPYSEDLVRRIVDRVDFPLDKRPEQLSPDQFIELARKIEEIVA
jgi:16S rRNA (adenine1518-N6/adenine1519-N6)-dimethyltransferase